MKKSEIHSDFVFISDDQSFESADPADGSFNDPAFLISAFNLTVLQSVMRSILPVWDKKTDTSCFQGSPKRIAIVRLVGNKLFRSRLRAPRAGPGYPDLIQGRFSERNLSRRGRFDQASQRYTLCIDRTIHFDLLPFLVFPTPTPLFLPEQSFRP